MLEDYPRQLEAEARGPAGAAPLSSLVVPPLLRMLQHASPEVGGLALRARTTRNSARTAAYKARPACTPAVGAWRIGLVA